MTDTSSPGFVVQVMASAKDARMGASSSFGTNLPVLARMNDFSPRVEKFEVTDDIKLFKKLTLTVDNFDLYFFNHPAWVIGNIVRFFWGYPGRIQGPYWAMIDSVRGFQKLQITCTERAALSNEEKDREWKNTTRVAIVATLIKEGAFPGTSKIALERDKPLDPAAFVLQQDVIAALLSPTVIFGSPLAEKPRDYLQSRQTDWQFVCRLADDVGFEVYVEDEVLHFHSASMNAIPIRKYEWYTGAGELLNFSIDEWRALDRSLFINIFGRDPIGRVNISGTGSDTTTNRTTLGDQGISGQATVYKPTDKSGKFSKVAGKVKAPTPATDPATVANIADARFRLFEQEEVQASATVIGDPLLRSDRLIELSGISRSLSGNYRIEQVVHRIDSSGYKSMLKIHRDAVSSLPSSDGPDLDPSKTKTNKNHAGNYRQTAQGGHLTKLP